MGLLVVFLTEKWVYSSTVEWAADYRLMEVRIFLDPLMSYIDAKSRRVSYRGFVRQFVELEVSDRYRVPAQ